MKNDSPILLIEDDIVDAMTVSRAYKELGVTNEIIQVKNGEEALKYLSNPHSPPPNIILLDLNMPIMNGVEFLKERMLHPDLLKIPVIVLTTSRAENDKSHCFDLGISGYMVKPVDYGEFVDTIKIINNYWATSELQA